MTSVAPLDAVADATERQRRASDPATSAWVVASAGSGKTQVLTDRILRLLLAGAKPESLLCLTYTRAAAANMATRLHRDLAAWARPGSNRLGSDLERLTGTPPDAAQLDQARKLLAAALDAPGGMRIATLHSFAQALLRRFPLEAGVAPHFKLLDDAERADLLRDAREGVFALAERDAPLHMALDRLARQFAPGRFGDLVNAVIAGGRTVPGRARMLALLGLPPDATRAGLMAEATQGGDDAALRAAVQALGLGTETEQERARAMSAWLDADASGRVEFFDGWCRHFVTQQGTVRADRNLASKGVEKARPGTLEHLKAEAERLIDITSRLAALNAADVTGALATLTAPVFRRFAAAKQHRAALDYDDLIQGAETLLRGDEAPWVLFRLDGGLDHLLIDEAQDTSPAQWAIARALTAEFFAGEGARAATRRTVFAVGDPKQSIFSFQGADVAAFQAASSGFARAAITAGAGFEAVDLPISFRSTPAVLDLVNVIGQKPEWPTHTPSRAGQGGTVELWPLVPPPPKPDDPFDTDRPAEADQTCAEQLAATLDRWIGRLDMPWRGRALQAGDILVLVRRRKAFVGHLTRALKKLGVPMAGLDRLRLTDSLAVQDCLAFLDALLLPEDDLNLAAVLKGPFCQLDETSLMELALGRTGRLIAALRRRRDDREDWRWADRLIEKFRGRADFADAHALLSELLDHPTPDAPTGRAALIARLGEEAVEPLDELMQAALADSLRHPPSLQGFLHRLRTANAEIRRDADQRTDAVRIMTVHGAKGLQAPLVVLADTMSLPEPPKGLVRIDGAPVWLPPKAARPPLLEASSDAAHAAAMQEYERLMYVALTRAEDRLVVVGWQGRKQQADEHATWYRRIEAGMGKLGAARIDDPDIGPVRRHAPTRTATDPDREAAPADASRPSALPAWAVPAPPELPAPSRLKPSGDDDVPEPPSAPAPFAGPDRSAARLRRGDLTHLLLQWLPTLPERDRLAATARWLDQHAADLLADQRAAIGHEALAVLYHPEAAPLFHPTGLSEAPIVGMLGERVVNGVIDRLVVTPEKIWLADYKTDRNPPERVEDAPEKYIRQLAIYRSLLGRLYPGRPIEAVLVWTAMPRIARLPTQLLDRFAPAA
jgi:ATP-dependent helicase/nuclease subunit A